MRLHVCVQTFLDGFTPGFFGKPSRPGAPEYLFTQDAEDDEDDAGPGDVLVIT
jgi:hypothetical protein